ncbi:MAG: MGMT family protein [Synergistetes bacterium]|nr:MGMT family protein [Synergistota bacterium]
MDIGYVAFTLGYIEIGVKGEKVEYVRYTTTPTALPLSHNKYLNKLKKDITKYLRGEKVDFRTYRLNLDNISPFETMVYRATSSIPYAEVKSYKWVATQIGKPHAYRAVGNALKKNPFLLLVPCHRVWKNNREIGGFSAGVELKRYLCSIEGTSP